MDNMINVINLSSMAYDGIICTSVADNVYDNFSPGNITDDIILSLIHYDDFSPGNIIDDMILSLIHYDDLEHHLYHQIFINYYMI
jgi:hypothetical protein